MGPLQGCREPASFQATRRLGRRLCLLKGCERRFQPDHPFSRYCSPDCRTAARRWHRQQANARYRVSEQGKSRRRAQSCRYRERIRDRDEASSSLFSSGEGYHKADASQTFSCHRPGCYERFAKTARSPLQKFCSSGCRQALRRVLIRERRWTRALQRTARGDWRADDSW